MTEPIHIISLGAGVQSSTMALMAAHGEITPMPKCAIFADTQDEPVEVYVWLAKLRALLPFPVVRVSKGKLSDAILNGWNFSQIPAWFLGKKGPSLGRRQCTRHYKIVPIRREIRSRYPRQTVTMWIGISWDEIHRMKPSGRQWLIHRHPLIDKRMSRRDCEKKLRSFGVTSVPKSACIMCPYRGEKQWAKSRNNLRDSRLIKKVEGVLIPRGEFLTSQLVPIADADFSTDEDHGQQVMFGNECEGMCGV